MTVNESQYLVMFSILMMLALVWLGLCMWTFRRLERVHPEKYAEMGRPSLFLRNSIENRWILLRFLWKSEYTTSKILLSVARATL